jgi:hypothetical protein
MRNKSLQVILTLLVAILTACASSPNKPNTQATVVDIPASSKFTKVKVGMSAKQVHDLIGEPTDIANHMTGKMFIPFYFGHDAMRMVELYKGQGRIIYNGVGIGSMSFNVFQIEYDPSEDGYNNK